MHYWSRPMSHLLLFALLAGACSGGGDGGKDGDGTSVPVTTISYSVRFSPDQVVGAPAAPTSVSATASLSAARGDDTTASGSVTVTGVAATAVSINTGYAGESGPAIVTLLDRGSGIWALPTGTTIDDGEYFRLQASGYYVSIQTALGELRGQILPPGWGMAMVDLDASAVIPPVVSSGTAKAGFALNPTNGIYRGRITVNGVSDATSAGIRNAIPGARGDVIGSFEKSLGNPNVWGSRDINDANADDTFGATQIEKLTNGALYLSVETARNPEGELRGQLHGDETRVFEVAMSPLEVVTNGPPVTSDATGTATVTWADVISRLAVAVNTDITDALSVSVHFGAAGEVGSLLFSLAPDVTLPGNWAMTPVVLTEQQADAFRNGDLYVEVATTAHMQGELRGQLAEPAALAYDFDASRAVDNVLESTGGELSAVDGNGVQITLTVPPDGVSEATLFAVIPASAIRGAPAGFNPLTAAKFQPSGAAFGGTMKVSLLIPADQIADKVLVGFFTEDDGSEFHFVPLVAKSEPSPGVLEFSTYTSGFSVGGAGTADGAVVSPAKPGTSDAEKLAKHEIALIASALGERQKADPGATFTDEERSAIIAAFRQWDADIRRRLDEIVQLINANKFELADLSRAIALQAESQTLIELAKQLLQEDLLPEVDAKTIVADELARSVKASYDDCATPNLAAIVASEALRENQIPILQKIGRNEDLPIIDNPQETIPCRYQIAFEPPFSRLETISDVVHTELVAQSYNPGKSTFSEPIGGFGFPLLGDYLLEKTDNVGDITVSGNVLEFGVTTPDDASVTFSSDGLQGGRIIGSTSARARVSPLLAGTYTVSYSGTAGGCTDPEDDGPASGQFTVGLVSNVVLKSESATTYQLQGGSNNVILNLLVTDNANPLALDEAGGSGSFFEVETIVFDIDGTEVTCTYTSTATGFFDGSATITDSGIAIGLTLTDFTNSYTGVPAECGSGSCSTLTGTATLTRGPAPF